MPRGLQSCCGGRWLRSRDGAPTPLLLVVTDRETIVPTDIALRIFTQQAFEPKQVVLVPGEHFEVYTGQGFALSSQAALAWFRQWLMPLAR